MRRSSQTIVMAVGVLILAATAGFGYSGTLTWDPAETQLNAADGTSWASTSTSLYWQVDQVGSVWHYLYTFTVPAKNVSHLILETSDNVVLGVDIYNYILSGGATAPVGPQTWTATGQGSSNPDMPAGGVYGIKFDTGSPGSTSWTIEFTSTRRPVWGDFYAKCGAQDGEFNTVFNAGFTGGMFDPNGFVTRNGLASDNRLAVPDTVVPEPSALMGVLFGLPFVLARRLRLSR